MVKVRQALLEDVLGITEVYRSLVPAWTRGGQPVKYTDLSLYERWQHGGPWLSVETCAVWLGHLLQRSEGIPLVAELGNKIIAYAEVFVGDETEPYGYHLNISSLMVHQAQQRKGAGTALVAYAEEMGQALGCQRVTAAYAEPIPFWEKLGYTPLMERQRVVMKAETGRVFYKARELTEDHPQQILQWHTPIGRFQNGREEWERMWWHIWTGIPQLVEAKWHRFLIDLTGQPTILHLHQHDDAPEVVTARIWTKYELTTQVVSAMRDRAALLDYRYITTIVDMPLRSFLLEADSIGQSQWLYAKSLRP